MKETKYVFLSHNMSKETPEKVKEMRESAKKYLREKYTEYNLEFIDNYNHMYAPDGADTFKFIQNDENDTIGCEYTRLYEDFAISRIESDNDIEAYLELDFESNPNRLALWHLGRSIQQLSQADFVYFIPEFCDSRGCKVERLILELYGKNIKILE